ncbi:MAG TPA: hypothetical protein VJ508_15565 [Saprospiraceae bacterium]|nr:hypothetical protein [Saprospiraceae bacterium]
MFGLFGKKSTAATTKARASMHIKVIRKDGTEEEFDVPVSTDLSKEQVRKLIAAHVGTCKKPAVATVNAQHCCEEHLQMLRDSMTEQVNAIPAKGTCSF